MTPPVLLALALSTLIGLSLGLLGGGGSILALPVLVYVAGLDVHAAVGASLAVVGTTALVGGLAHARSGRVDLRAAALFGGAGMLGAPLGAQATHAVAPRVLLLLFAGLMLVVGGLMLRGGGAARRDARPHPVAVPAAGLGVGLLTGFLGVGGGFLIVPALTLLAGLEVHAAVGTSLLVIAASSAAGILAHLHQGEMPLGLTAAFTAAAAAGALAGVRLAASLEPERLRRAFAVFVVLVGLFLLAKNALAP
ncbi:MAG TPA: sulfite exporter TauE/SafE family protein [Vicinamibacteria bacterium]